MTNCNFVLPLHDRRIFKHCRQVSAVITVIEMSNTVKFSTKDQYPDISRIKKRWQSTYL